MERHERRLLPLFFKLGKSYWVSERRWEARILLGAAIALTLGSVFMFVQLNEWNGQLFTALQNFNKKALFPLAVKFLIILFGIITVGAYCQYLSQLLQIKWREWMTQSMLNQWIKTRNHYFIQFAKKPLENPDQRISEDVREFVELSLNLSLGLLKQMVTLMSFIKILWTMSGSLNFKIFNVQIVIPGYLVIGSLFYAIIGSILTHRIGKKLSQINYEQEQYEADFRFNLARFRENTESITLSRAEDYEVSFALKKFLLIRENFKALINKQKQLGYFTNLFGNASQLVPLLLVTPQYFSRSIDLGGLMQTINSFGRVEQALSWFVHNYVEWSRWKAVVLRLEGFSNSIEQAHDLQMKLKSEMNYSEGSSDIHVQIPRLSLPADQSLLQNIYFSLPKGKSLLLYGTSGCGKSTLLRAICGVWPFTRGEVNLPSMEKMMIIPQRSYLPMDTLRAVILYPKSSQSSPVLSDQEWLGLLSMVNLEHLQARLDHLENWSQVLSPGEQQRIALLRIFIQKPDYLFLDEATSALDEMTQSRIYSLIKQRFPQMTIISIAHRNSLFQVHDLHFDVENQSWTQAA
jgi:vitamin B12/bleomycin/antimicrobial peptide transport system ATP-binding/permease protein